MILLNEDFITFHASLLHVGKYRKYPEKNTIGKFKVSSVLLPEFPGVLSWVIEPIRRKLNMFTHCDRHESKELVFKPKIE